MVFYFIKQSIQNGIGGFLGIHSVVITFRNGSHAGNDVSSNCLREEKQRNERKNILAHFT